jgi:hypothetical protein
MDAVVRQRPRTVTISVAILAVLWLVGLVMSLMEPPTSKNISALTKAIPVLQYIQITLAILGSILFAFVIYKIYTGRNWARILSLVVFILVTLPSIPAELGLIHASPEGRIIGAVRLAAISVAMLLLFTSPGDLWFRRRAA